MLPLFVRVLSLKWAKAVENFHYNFAVHLTRTLLLWCRKKRPKQKQKQNVMFSVGQLKNLFDCLANGHWEPCIEIFIAYLCIFIYIHNFYCVFDHFSTTSIMTLRICIAKSICINIRSYLLVHITLWPMSYFICRWDSISIIAEEHLLSDGLCQVHWLLLLLLPLLLLRLIHFFIKLLLRDFSHSY